MTSLSELISEAEWSIEHQDVENALLCIRLAGVLHGSQSTETSVTKRKKKSKKTSSRKKTKKGLKLFIVGKLPDNLDAQAFRGAVVPMLQDCIQGDVLYRGFNRMANGTYCYNFTGMCPIHLRAHSNVGPWQLKQHPKQEWCGWKCWKQDSYKKLFSNPILCSF